MARKLTKAQIAERDATYARIRSEFAMMRESIMAIDLPEDHEWWVQRCWDTWFLGDLKQSLNGTGASILLGRPGADVEDPDQMHGEVRIFWEELKDRPMDGHPFYAIVWAERGARIYGRKRIDHVKPGSTYFECQRHMPRTAEDGERHLYAGTIDALKDGIVAIMERIMAADRACVADGSAAALPYVTQIAA